MKKVIRKIIPERIILLYHYFVASFAAFYCGFPSKKMIIIGVTGTKGKTSTVNFIWNTLTEGGYKTGIISTANIKIGEKDFLNKYHMTMPGRFTIQKFLSRMVKEGCEICIVETTSEGIKQHRHSGIYYDIAVFTNLSPEHLPSHGGSFEKYKKTKGKMFKNLFACPKKIRNKEMEKIIIANKDNKHADYFMHFNADKKITFGLKEKADFVARNIEETKQGVRFNLKENHFQTGIPGIFNVYNALPAIIICQLFQVKEDLIAKGLLRLKVIPGRMEEMHEGQNFRVFVDYAHEKESMGNVLKTAGNIKNDNGKVIVLLGAEGGGRDKSKRPDMGELAGKMADSVVVSNVDPYEDDPTEIAEDIAVVAEKFGKKREESLFVIEDRRLGIRKALSLAKENDIVLITGKGAEQSMIVDGKEFPWDDREVVKEEIENIKGTV